MIGMSIACSSRTFKDGVISISTTVFDLTTLEKLESKSFYFDNPPTKHSFKTEKDRELWEYYKNKAEDEEVSFIAYLMSFEQPIKFLMHNSSYDSAILSTLNIEAVEIMQNSICLMTTAEFINHVYGEDVYEYQSFDYMCEHHGITKGTKAQKQLRIYREMVKELSKDVKDSGTSPSEPCYYCGATAKVASTGSCFLCGRVSLPIAYAEFVGDLIKNKPVTGQALNNATNLKSLGENQILIEFSNKDYYDIVRANRDYVLDAMKAYFGYDDITFKIDLVK